MIEVINKKDVLTYIDRVEHSGMGKTKSIEYIKKYISYSNVALVEEEAFETKVHVELDLLPGLYSVQVNEDSSFSYGILIGEEDKL